MALSHSPAISPKGILKSLAIVATLALTVWGIATGLSRSTREVSWTDSERQQVKNFIESIAENKEARAIAYTGPEPKRIEESSISHQDYLRFTTHLQAALTNARLVSDSILDKLHPELKRHFRDQFQKGLELQIAGISTGKAKEQIEGQMLMDQWLDWLEANRRVINSTIDGALASRH